MVMLDENSLLSTEKGEDEFGVSISPYPSVAEFGGLSHQAGIPFLATY